MSGIVALIIVVRLVLWWSSRSDGRRERTGGIPGVRRGLWRRGVWLVAAACAVSVFYEGGPLWFGVLCTLFVAQGWLVDAVLIPAGFPRLSYWYTRAVFFFGGDAEAAFNAARASLSRGREPRVLSDFAELFHEYDDRHARGEALATKAVLEAQTGNTELARDLFSAIQGLRASDAQRSTRAYSQAWLLADAAGRGAFDEVLRLATRGPFTARRLFITAAARRLLRLPSAPSRLSLKLLWLLAPARRHTWSLLRQALASEPRSELAVPTPDLDGARRATVELLCLAPGMVSRKELRRVAEAWQQLFESGDLVRWFEARALALGTSLDAAALAQRARGEVVDVFASVLRHTLPDRDEEDEPELLLLAADRIADELLGEIEALCESLRVSDEPLGHGYDEYWRSWARVRALGDYLVDVLPERKEQLLDSVGVTLMNHGAWLYNVERARALAHDMFRWLVAIAPKSWSDYPVLRRNARISG